MVSAPNNGANNGAGLVFAAQVAGGAANLGLATYMLLENCWTLLFAWTTGRLCSRSKPWFEYAWDSFNWSFGVLYWSRLTGALAHKVHRTFFESQPQRA